MKSKNCDHLFVPLTTFEQKLWIFTIRTDHYSICSKCNIIRHDEDGDLFFDVEGALKK